MADDQDLNNYVSLKKMAPFRSSEKDKTWKAKFKKSKKKKLKEFREKLKQQNIQD
jgi:protein KRI1